MNTMESQVRLWAKLMPNEIQISDFEKPENAFFVFNEPKNKISACGLNKFDSTYEYDAAFAFLSSKIHQKGWSFHIKMHQTGELMTSRKNYTARITINKINSITANSPLNLDAIKEDYLSFVTLLCCYNKALESLKDWERFSLNDKQGRPVPAIARIRS